MDVTAVTVCFRDCHARRHGRDRLSVSVTAVTAGVTAVTWLGCDSSQLNESRSSRRCGLRAVLLVGSPGEQQGKLAGLRATDGSLADFGGVLGGDGHLDRGLGRLVLAAEVAVLAGKLLVAVRPDHLRKAAGHGAERALACVERLECTHTLRGVSNHLLGLLAIGLALAAQMPPHGHQTRLRFTISGCST